MSEEEYSGDHCLNCKGFTDMEHFINHQFYCKIKEIPVHAGWCPLFERKDENEKEN